MSKIDKGLSKVFDLPDQTVITPCPTDIIEKANELPSAVDDAANVMSGYDPRDAKIESDYDTTRTNLLHILQKGQDALNHALEIAKQSEHPRAFEVVGNLMKQQADINQQLLDLHQQKQKLELKDEKKAPGVQNNSIYVGSTTELNKFLKDMKSNTIEGDE
jgi:hypothetical protein|tara:strand:- start:9026 stop:9508 length:483 start_codon:yes stop_codon:yes gene_type:complete